MVTLLPVTFVLQRKLKDNRRKQPKTENRRREVAEFRNYREIKCSRNCGVIYFSMTVTPKPALICFYWLVLFTNRVFIRYIYFPVSQSEAMLRWRMNLYHPKKVKYFPRSADHLLDCLYHLTNLEFDVTILVSYMCNYGDKWGTNNNCDSENSNNVKWALKQ